MASDVIRMTRVRGHYRTDGSYVRPHRRQIGVPAVASAAGGGLLVFFLILAALSSGGGGAVQTPAPSAPASVAPGLPR